MQNDSNQGQGTLFIGSSLGDKSKCRSGARLFRYANILFKTNKGSLRALRFIVRGLLSPMATDRWLGFLDSRLLASANENVRPELIMKIHRPFSRRSLSTAERVALLIEHYTILIQALGPDKLSWLLTERPIKLMSMEGRKGESYTLHLCRDRRYCKEGEIAIAFVDDARQETLAALSMAIGADEQGRRCLHVGGLQGPRLPLGKAEIVHATRSLDGLRPKRAVFEAACALADWFGAESLRLTSRAGHVMQGHGFRRRTIYAEYDRFWEEFGAHRLPGGDYSLSLPLPRRDIEDVAAKKRKEWLKRQDRLGALSSGVTLFLSQWAVVKPPRPVLIREPIYAPIRKPTDWRTCADRWIKSMAGGLMLPTPATAVLACCLLLSVAVGWAATSVLLKPLQVLKVVCRCFRTNARYVLRNDKSYGAPSTTLDLDSRSGGSAELLEVQDRGWTPRLQNWDDDLLVKVRWESPVRRSAFRG